MRTELRNQLLYISFNCDRHDRGMTIIELMVVLMIAGFLAAIALPSFLNQVNNARHAEAQTYVGSINRSQQTYFLENSRFATLAELDIGISDSKNYTYTSIPTTSGATSVALTEATPVGLAKGYAGKVWIGIGSDGNSTSLSMVCAGGAGVVPTLNGTTCP